MHKSSIFTNVSFLFVGTLLTVSAVSDSAFARSPGGGGRLHGALKPRSGRIAYQELSELSLKGGVVNLANGNLHIKRPDLSLKTLIGEFELGAVYNSANNRWLWDFDLKLQEKTFRDFTGAQHRHGRLENGQGIPGTHWIKHSDTAMRTKGGLVYEFTKTKLANIHWLNQPYPRVKFSRTNEGRLKHIDECADEQRCRVIFSFEYTNDRVTKIKDVVGKRSRIFAYDTKGNLVRVFFFSPSARRGVQYAMSVGGFSYEYSFGFSGQEHLSAMTNAEGERIEYEFHPISGQLKNLRQVGQENGNNDLVHRFRYRKLSNRFWFQKSPLLYETVVTNPDNSTRTWKVHRNGATNSSTNEMQEETCYTWDNKKRLTSKTDPAGNTTTWDYKAQESTLVVRETQPRGNVVKTNYRLEALNRKNRYALPVEAVSDKLGDIQRFTYGELGELQSVANGEGEESSPFETIGGSVSGARSNEGVEFNALGDLISGPDVRTPTSPGRPGVVKRSFNDDRLVDSLTLTDTWGEKKETLKINYRSDGQLLEILRPYGGDTQYTYDAFGRLVERKVRVDGHWQIRVFEYDTRGRLIAEERSNGMRTEFAHDAAGRVIHVLHMRRTGFGDDAIIEKEMRQTYENGLLVTRCDSTYGCDPSSPGQSEKTEKMVYDDGGLLSEISYPGGEYLLLDHDKRGRLIGRVFMRANGSLLRSISAEYDKANRLVSLTDSGKNGIDDLKLVRKKYIAGKVSEILYGNGLKRTFLYDGTGNLEETKTLGKAGMPLEHREIQRIANCGSDNFGPNIDDLPRLDCLNIVDRLLPACALVTSSSECTPVEDHQLSPGHSSSEELFGGARVVGSNGQMFVYDELDNILSINKGESENEFVYNAEHNRLNSTAEHTYLYDNAGFVIQRDEVLYTWDAMGLTKSRGLADNMDTFVWDSLGRPVKRVLFGLTTTYLFGGQVEADASYRPTSLDLKVVRLFFDESDERAYRHFDLRGNVQFISYNDGDFIYTFTYDAYGARTMKVAGVGSANTDEEETPKDLMGFAEGDQFDTVIRLGVRLYDSSTGRFLSPDPIHQMINQYQYAEGNPIDFWDPTGEFSIGIGGGFYVFNIGYSGGGFGWRTSCSQAPLDGVLLYVLIPSLLFFGKRRRRKKLWAC
jgi:RHS repeat-associated protein